MKTDIVFLKFGLCYAIIGMVLGIAMAATHNHGQMVTHAHIMLVGFVTSFVYGVIHKVWLNGDQGLISKIQLWLHQLGILGMAIGLYLLYGNKIAPPTIEPILSVSSIAVLIATILMFVMVIKSVKK